MAKMPEDVFFLDTNVILHNSNGIYDYGEGHVIISIAVVEELDHFKKGHEEINMHARNFTRTIRQMDRKMLFNGGAPLGDKGRISVCLNREYHPDILKNISSDIPDNRILNSAYWYQQDHPNARVTVVSKDENVRLKAGAFGLFDDDYTTDYSSIDPYQQQLVVEGMNAETIARIFAEREISCSDLPMPCDLIGNQYVTFKNGKQSALAAFNCIVNIYR